MVRLVFFTLQGLPISYSFKLNFPCMNNNAEYEALLLDLKVTIELKFEHLLIYDDSQLVVNHILSTEQYHNEFLKVYRDMALNLLKWFKLYKIESTP